MSQSDSGDGGLYGWLKEKFSTGDVSSKADGEEEFSADLFRVLAAEDDETDYNGDVLGIGVDFPESGVYIDWRREAFPDQLEHPHVSDYGSIEDLEKATGNVIEPLSYGGSVDAGGESSKAEPSTRQVRLSRVDLAPGGVTVKADDQGLYYDAWAGVATKSVPDNAVSINDRSEAPENAEVVTGDRGGLYYIPGEGDDDRDGEGEDEDGDGEFEPGEELTADELEPGMEVSIMGDRAEIDSVNEDGQNGETTIGFRNLDMDEQFVIDEDILEGEIEATEATESSGGGDSGDEPQGDGDDTPDDLPVDPDDDPDFAEAVRSFDSEAAPDHLDVSQAESVQTLSEAGIPGGHDADNMRVVEMEDGGRAFTRANFDGEGNVEGVADVGTFYDAIGANVPDVHYDEESDMMVSEEADGQPLGEFEGEVDADSFYDAAAASLLAGNQDLHGENLFVDDDGQMSVIDFDFGGRQLYNNEENQREMDLSREAFTSNAEYTAELAGVADDPDEFLEELRDRVDELAADLDPEEATEALGTQSVKEALQENIRGIQEGESWP